MVHAAHRSRLAQRLSEVGVDGDVVGLADFLMADEVSREAVASTLVFDLESREVDGSRQVRLVSPWCDSLRQAVR